MLGLLSWCDYALAGLGFFVLVKAVLYFSSSNHRLPPGPPTDPIIGHARTILPKDTFKTYAKWGKTLGASVCFVVPG